MLFSGPEPDIFEQADDSEASARRKPSENHRSMKRMMLKSKIHRATVTDASLDYEGSVTIDALLMEATDIVEWEQVDVYDITNGSRLTTYAISGEPGSGVICLNGAAARLVNIGDLVIICSYAEFSEEERRKHVPKIVMVNRENQVASHKKKVLPE